MTRPRLSFAVVSAARRLRREGGKLSAIASATGISLGAAHKAVRDIACPINHSSMALRRQVSFVRQASQDYAHDRSKQDHPQVLSLQHLKQEGLSRCDQFETVSEQ